MKTYGMSTMLTLAVVLNGTALAGQPARSATEPAVMLQTAMHLDQVEGRMPEAIAAYRQVLSQAGADKAVAAQALLRLAIAYEKLGRPEARATYERVLRDFGDQPKVSAAARARLAKTTAARHTAANVEPRQLTEGVWSTLNDVSRDGRWAVGSERRGYSSYDIVLHDLHTGRATVLAAGTRERSGMAPRISPDGRLVAYAWREGEQDAYLRVVDTNQPAIAPRLFRATPATSIYPLDWAPDGKKVLVALRRDQGAAPTPTSVELAWITLESGAVQVLASVNEGFLAHAELSLDGRHVALSAVPRPGALDRYLYVLDAYTGTQRSTLAMAGARYRPFWAPDGDRLVYVDRLGDTAELWSVRVVDGVITGEPVRVQEVLQGTPITLTGDGTLLVSRTEGRRGNRVYLSDRRPASSDRVTILEGLGVSWSRDGRQLAMMRQSASQSDLTLVVRNLATGQERSYHTPGLAMYTPQWLPGSAAAVVVVNEPRDGKAVRAFHRVDLDSGTFTRLFPRDTPTHTRTNNGVLSADGKTLYLGRSMGEGQPIRDIVAVELATGVERHVASIDGAAGGAVAGLALSPDGRTLAVTTWVREYEAASLSTIALDDGRVRPLVNRFDTGWLADDLRWSPDGEAIVFTAFDPHSQWRLLRVPASGGTPEPDGLDYDTLAPLLGETRMFPGNFNNFDLSPDGTRVAASTLTWSKAEVWTLDLAALIAARN